MYFIAKDDFLGTDHERTTNGTHPNDLGFDRIIAIIQPQLMKILKTY
ncbi:MAG: SGNH/GDSL hydrolase family protein [Bacteroidales bacterium]